MYFITAVLVMLASSVLAIPAPAPAPVPAPVSAPSSFGSSLLVARGPSPDSGEGDLMKRVSTCYADCVCDATVCEWFCGTPPPAGTTYTNSNGNSFTFTPGYDGTDAYICLDVAGSCDDACDGS